jgi:hypothetical protein
MRVRTYVLTATVALTLSFSLLAQQPPAGPPQPAPSPAPLAPPAPFYPHIVSTGLRGGYQVVAADMNKDGKVDLIGLGSQNPELVWYENPYWTPHVITRDAPRMVNLAAADVDGDGSPELADACEGGTTRQNAGKIAILKSGKDPRELWTFTKIDELPMTSHRVRFLKIGNQTLLISAPIITAESTDGFANTNHTTTPLHAYRPPDWKRETITEESKGVVHGLLINDWDGDGRDDVITAGYLGVFVHMLGKDGKWTRSQIVAGNPAEWPQSGTSDIVVGRLGGRKFMAANEPFHGNQVIVYTDAGGTWARTMIDDSINNSLSLALVDSDGDGTSEIVSGGTRGAPGTARGAKPGVFFYKAADPAGQKWDRMVLDATIAANGCVAADINGDRKMDIACIDAGAPWSLIWYENSRK